MNLKEYLPSYKTIPAVMILGAAGAAIFWKLLPNVFQWMATKTPSLQKPPAAA